MITIEDIKNDESKNLELKEMIPSNSIKYLKSVSAFSNSAGGKIIFGIADGTLEVVGVDGDIHKKIDAITNAISDSITPQIIPNIYVDEIENKKVIVCEIYRGSSTPYYVKSYGKKDGTYIRTAGTTRPADEGMLKELELTGVNRSYDELPYETMKPLTDEEIETMCIRLTNYAKDNAKTIEEKNKVKTLTLAKMLSWKFVIKQDEKYYPSNAYMMFTDDNPFQFINIQCARFKGTNRVLFIDKKEYDGPLYEQIDETMKFIMNHLNMEVKIVPNKIAHEERFEIPTEAIREILVNAVCHRLLTDNSRVQVAIYDDRVEITSPGVLANGLTLKGMLEGKTSTRNACIVNVFSYLNIIENWGTGVQRSILLCEEAGVKVPEFIEMDSAIRVNFYRLSYKTDQVSDQVSDQVGDQDDELFKSIILYCKTPKSLREIMEKFGFKQRINFKNKYINPLIEKGKLSLTIPDKPNSSNQKYVSYGYDILE